MAESAFDASGYDIKELWTLAAGDADGINSRNVLRWENDTLVVLFTDRKVAYRYAVEISKRGNPASAYGFPSFDELTDTLARLRDLGATHVTFDSVRDDSPRYPITSVIIGFQVRG